MGMRLSLLALVTVGCNAVGLGPTADRCTFSFTDPSMSGNAACSMERDAHAVHFALDGERPFTLDVVTDEVDGYARLEGADTKRNMPGEVYGTTSLLFDGCTDWGGHASWHTDGETWSLELVSTCARGAADALYLNGAVMRE